MKIIGFIFLVALLGGVGFLYTQNDAVVPTEYRTAAITRGNISSSITATGTIEPVEVIDVGAQIAGRIKRFGEDPDQPGKTIDFVSKVKAGAVIAEIDDLPYKAELERATADLKLAQAEMKRAVTQSEQAGRDQKRAEAARQSTSESEYEAFVTAAAVAQDEVAIANAKVAQAKVAVKSAEINLEFTRISSPIDGVVLDRRVNVGQTVVAGLNAPSLFLIAKDLKHMRIWAAVNEADIGQVHIGQAVHFTVDAYRDEKFTGKVSQIRLNASTAHSVVTYGVIVDIDNTDGRLLPYMTANISFSVAERQNATLATNQALRWQPTLEDIDAEHRPKYEQNKGNDSKSDQSKIAVTEPTIWVRSGESKVKPIEVQVGISNGFETELISDKLKENDQVVVGTVKHRQPDFVSSFISRVSKPKE